MIERLGRCGAWLLATVVLVAALSSSTCQSSSGNGDGLPPLDLGAYDMVLHHAESAFGFHFDRDADGPPLREFHTDSEAATDRDGLVAAWNGVEELRDAGPDFLGDQIFSRAMAEPDWPAEPVDERAVFVGGTRDALEAFLAGED